MIQRPGGEIELDRELNIRINAYYLCSPVSMRRGCLSSPEGEGTM